MRKAGPCSATTLATAASTRSTRAAGLSVESASNIVSGSGMATSRGVSTRSDSMFGK